MRGVFQEVVGMDEGVGKEVGKPRGGGLHMGTIRKTFPDRLHHLPSPAIVPMFPRLVKMPHPCTRTSPFHFIGHVDELCLSLFGVLTLQPGLRPPAGAQMTQSDQAVRKMVPVHTEGARTY